MIPVLLHIPHSSRDIPQEYRSDIVLDDKTLERELVALTDLYTDELYQCDGAERAVFPVSRYILDPERFANDDEETMAARGMGVIYTVTTELKPLRAAPSTAQRQELLNRYYYPHHARLNDWADKALSQRGRGLLIDCHSFPSQALPYELEVAPRHRPQICIGTSVFHTPPELRSAIVTAFAQRGYEVGIDSPFAGTLTPSRHYGASPALMAFMIEVRKDLYVDEVTGAKLSAFNKVQDDITRCIAEAVACADSLTILNSAA